MNGSIFTTIDYPGATWTEVTGINDAGQIVGDYSDISGIHGFLKDGDVFTPFDYPGSHRTFPNDINNEGQIVGLYSLYEGQEGDAYGFVLDGSIFTTIDYPGAGETYAYGINDAGQVVGVYNNAVAPEPATMLLLGLGLMGLAGVRRKFSN